MSTCQISSFTKVVCFSFGTFFIFYFLRDNIFVLVKLSLFINPFSFHEIHILHDLGSLFTVLSSWNLMQIGHIRFYFSHVKKNLIRIIFGSYNHCESLFLFLFFIPGKLHIQYLHKRSIILIATSYFNKL